MSGAGSQMRVVPEGLRTSTRVVTSNVRHGSTALPRAKGRPTFGNARLAAKTDVDRRKSRRFMLPSFAKRNLLLLAARRIAYTRLGRRATYEADYWSLRSEYRTLCGSKTPRNTSLI